MYSQSGRPVSRQAQLPIYVPTGAGVMRSLDGGAPWDLEAAGLPQLQVNEIVIPPDAPNDVLAIGTKTINESADRGSSFTTRFTAAAGLRLRRPTPVSSRRAMV
jgi:hypothetical protein